ncbi:MAG: hypothetical protein C4305_07710 [Thermoleophilia bacterium]
MRDPLSPSTSRDPGHDWASRTRMSLACLRMPRRAAYSSRVTRLWPEPVERVRTYLLRAGAEARVEELPLPTRTAAEAARAVGCDLDRIVKALVLECDGRPVVAMVPGDRRADPGKVARAAGVTKARVASPERVRAATGFEPGAVAPFPLPQVDRVLIDRSLLRHDWVWAGAGSSRHLVRLSPAELVRLSRAIVTDVAREE